MEKLLPRELAELDADTLAALSAELGELEGEPTVLGGGITNSNFRARFGGREVVVRLPGVDTELLGADRGAEVEAGERAAACGVAPPLVAVLPGRCLVTEFVPGETLTAERLRQPEALEEVAEMLRAVHACTPIGAVFDSFRLVEDYAAASRDRGGEVPAAFEEAKAAATRIEVALGSRAGPDALCHDDLLAANFIRSPQGFRLVDWEYAGMGSRWFDLGNFAVNNGLDGAAEGRLLAAYLGREPQPAELAALRLMRLMSDFREAMWGVVQRTISSIDFDFDGYAGEHFDRLLAGVADPGFEGLLEDAGAAG